MERGAQDWLDQVVGHLDAPMTPDTPLRMAANGILLADLFNTVQLAASGAQISVTSLANDAAGLPQIVCRRDILNAYPYTNTLTVLQITGAVLRRAMERSAEYFTRRADGMLDISDAFLKPKVEHYNYDYYAGVHYVFDCSRPVGSRVTELSVNGRPVADGDLGGIVGDLCAGRPAPAFAPLIAVPDRPAIIVSGLRHDNGELGAFLDLIKMGGASIPVRSMVTPTSKGWTLANLLLELNTEHETVQGGNA